MSKYLDSGGLSYLWSKIKSLFENKSNKVTSITETSTDEQYPSAKAVFDLVGSSGGDLKIKAGHVTSNYAGTNTVTLDFTPIAVIGHIISGSATTRIAVTGYPSQGKSATGLSTINHLEIITNGFNYNASGKYEEWNYIAIGT